MITKINEICVIGIWHLGSVVSTCLADLGYKVTGVDKDPKRVENLNAGIPPIFEPGIENLLRTNIDSGRLSYTTDLGNALGDSDFVWITFDTTIDDNDKVDLTTIFDTCIEISKYLRNGSIILVSSQVPVGTCDRIRSIIKQNNPSLDFDIAYSPENLRLGQSIECFEIPQMIVIGADNESTLDKVESLFKVIAAPKFRMDLKTAEMTKHALNTFFALSISFANEIASLCDEIGVDGLKVAEMLCLDERIGQKLPLKPGLGFSGGTLARDLKILQDLGNRANHETLLIDAILKVNEGQIKQIIKKLEKINGPLKNTNIGVLGLTYKAGTSTLRRSAALEIIRDLIRLKANVKAYDPKAALEEVQEHVEFELCHDPYTVAKGADALVIITDWPEFASLDFNIIKSVMRKPVIIDAKNMLDEKKMTEKGILYYGIGRGR